MLLSSVSCERLYSSASSSYTVNKGSFVYNITKDVAHLNG